MKQGKGRDAAQRGIPPFSLFIWSITVQVGASTYLNAMPNPNLRWLHISDLHVGKDLFGLKMTAIGLISFLRNKRDKEGFDPDIICFTGDIVNKGKAEEYREFNDIILFPLIELYGEAVEKKLHFVPGNHDVDRGCNEVIDTYPLLDKHPELMDSTEQGVSLRRLLAERFAGFRDALPGTTDIASLLGKDLYYSRILSIGDIKIGILGLNTAWLCQSDQDKSQLTPGRYAVKLGLESISICSIKIVIGHHPVAWFRPDDMEAIGALFAQYNVIYLHGHLHETLSSYQNHGANQYLDIQAGAVFDARESKNYPPTIIFGEFLSTPKAVALEPFQWNVPRQEWGLATGGLSETHRLKNQSKFLLPLPSNKATAVVGQSQRKTQVPSGWVMIARSFINKCGETQSTSEQILSYFDGRAPNWVDSASVVIPTREVGRDIVNEVIAGLENINTTVILLTGPSGEGKSTLLRQVCCMVMRRAPDTKLLFRNDDEADLSSDFILNHIDFEKTWLIVADDAGNISQNIFNQVQIVNRSRKYRIVYLVAARDTDWISNGARGLSWVNTCIYKEHIVRGITMADARSVVIAWGQYGELGLRKLSGLTVEDAAQALFQASQLEEEESEGAFLGAMLRLRYGKDLKNHIDSVLDRLRQLPATSNCSLLDVFAVIVALHRIAVRILDKSVLAELFQAKESDIRRYALAKLGDEAMVATGANRILTRHKAIADAAYALLEAKYGYDFFEIYKGVVNAAMSIMSSSRFLRNIGKWRYVSRELRIAGESDTAIAVAEIVAKYHPGNSFFTVHLASLHRQANRLDLALQAFRQSNIEAPENRAFFTEWSAAEESDGDHFAAIWIASLAIRDLHGGKEVSNDDAKMALSELLISGVSAYKKYNTQHFLKMAAVANLLGARLPLAKDERGTLDIHRDGVDWPIIGAISIGQMVSLLKASIQEAWLVAGKRKEPIPTGASAGGFTSFTRLLENLEDREQI